MQLQGHDTPILSLAAESGKMRILENKIQMIQTLMNPAFGFHKKFIIEAHILVRAHFFKRLYSNILFFFFLCRNRKILSDGGNDSTDKAK